MSVTRIDRKHCKRDEHEVERNKKEVHEKTQTVVIVAVNPCRQTDKRKWEQKIYSIIFYKVSSK